MRISDWSSDGCSSDLLAARDRLFGGRPIIALAVIAVVADIGDLAIDPLIDAREQLLLVQPGRSVRPAQIRLHQRRGRGAANMVPARIEARPLDWDRARSEEHTSELQSLMRTSY